MERKAAAGRGGSRFRIREVSAGDVGKGLLETLRSLSDLEGLTTAEAGEILKTMARAPFSQMLVAVTADGRVVGVTTLLVEQKLIHGGGRVGHIEDVAVSKGFEGKGVGSSLVKSAVQLAQDKGCYKVILDCKDDVVGFYEKAGFRRYEVGMRLDLKRRPRESSRS